MHWFQILKLNTAGEVDNQNIWPFRYWQTLSVFKHGGDNGKVGLDISTYVKSRFKECLNLLVVWEDIIYTILTNPSINVEVENKYMSDVFLFFLAIN